MSAETDNAAGMTLDERMAAAGMLPVSDMLAGGPFGKMLAHVGVTDLDAFEQWLLMRREECIRQQAQMTLDGAEQDELFEWVLAHNAVFAEVLANFRQATGRQPG